jgi:hypothetical protein
MRQDDLKALLHREPCPRLRLHLTGGEVFEITDREDAVVDRSTVQLLAPLPDQKEREAIINLLHVIWIEVLPSSS